MEDMYYDSLSQEEKMLIHLQQQKAEEQSMLELFEIIKKDKNWLKNKTIVFPSNRTEEVDIPYKVILTENLMEFFANKGKYEEAGFLKNILKCG